MYGEKRKIGYCLASWTCRYKYLYYVFNNGGRELYHICLTWPAMILFYSFLKYWKTSWLNPVNFSNQKRSDLTTNFHYSLITLWPYLTVLIRASSKYFYQPNFSFQVCFKPTDPHLLLSGSQDGTMKLFDLRIKDVVRTFVSTSESVRDVQFSPHLSNYFTSVSENGNVQMWDLRRTERFSLQFTAHSGPIFACDWHAEMRWLATASRDKTIKVKPTGSLLSRNNKYKSSATDCDGSWA